MQHLEVSGALRPIYGSLGVKRLRTRVIGHPPSVTGGGTPNFAPSGDCSLCLTAISRPKFLFSVAEFAAKRQRAVWLIGCVWTIARNGAAHREKTKSGFCFEAQTWIPWVELPAKHGLLCDCVRSVVTCSCLRSRHSGQHCVQTSALSLNRPSVKGPPVECAELRG
jgi:hypothetical protein